MPKNKVTREDLANMLAQKTQLSSNCWSNYNNVYRAIQKLERLSSRFFDPIIEADEIPSTPNTEDFDDLHC